jgi:hypothetical protein
LRCIAPLFRQGVVTIGRLQLDTPAMNIHLSLAPLISLIAGILILVMPKLLNFIVAVYLILIGLIGLFGSGTIKSWL